MALQLQPHRTDFLRMSIICQSPAFKATLRQAVLTLNQNSNNQSIQQNNLNQMKVQKLQIRNDMIITTSKSTKHRSS